MTQVELENTAEKSGTAVIDERDSHLKFSFTRDGDRSRHENDALPPPPYSKSSTNYLLPRQAPR